MITSKILIDASRRIVGGQIISDGSGVKCRIDTPIEIEYYRHGGILDYVLRNLLHEDE